MGAFIDLTGETIGEWEVLEYLGKSKWKCQNIYTSEIKNIHSYSLRTQYSDYTKINIGKPEVDLKDQKIGEWTVLEYVGNARWKCQCSCGNFREVKGHDLINGLSTKCNNPIHKNKVDLTGQQIGEWTVQYYAGNMRWHCKCSCENEKDVLTSQLVSGKSKSCGHDRNYHIIRKDITGQMFGFLEVLGYTGKDQMWTCKCHACNNIKDIFRDSLVSGKTKSCGCMKEKMRAKTLVERYGDTNTTRINNPREPWQIEVTSSKEKIEEYINSMDHIPTVYELSQLLGINDTSVIKMLKKFDLAESIVQKYNGVSDIELSILEFINEFGYEVIQNDRKILNGKELDIYIPEKQLAIEFNGDYWHSSLCKDYKYHQNKTIDCIKNKIHLIHIFEYEWRNEETKDKIKSYISSILDRTSTKIYARDTEVKAVGIEECKEFLNKYHLQGYTKSDIHFGCYYNNKIIGVMTFGTPRFNDNFEYELIRLCWKPDVQVTGGSEKLFSHFIKTFNPTSIISYCDLTKFSGEVYLRLGFKTSRECLTKPNYIWLNKSTGQLLTRYQTQKQKLLDDGLSEYGDTEDEIMYNLGYLKIYNSGNMRFEWYK